MRLARDSDSDSDSDIISNADVSSDACSDHVSSDECRGSSSGSALSALELHDNALATLDDLAPLSALGGLRTLKLRGNPLEATGRKAVLQALPQHAGFAKLTERQRSELERAISG